MKVRELVALLQTQNQDAEVGVTLTASCGYVQKVRGLALAPDGTVCVDQSENGYFEEEVELTWVKV